MPALWTESTHLAWCLYRNFPSMALFLTVSFLPAARGELILPWQEDEEQGILCGPLLIKQREETDVLHMPPRGGVMEITLRFNAFSNQNPTSFHLCKREWGKSKERLNPAIFLQILTREQSSICNQIRGIISVIKVNWESKWKNLMLFMLIYFRLEKVKPEVNTKRRSMERGAWQRQKVQIWAIIGVGLH